VTNEGQSVSEGDGAEAADPGTQRPAGLWVSGDEWLEWTREAPLAAPLLTAEDAALLRGLLPPAPRPAAVPVLRKLTLKRR
jgi:hypothetical protein